MSPLASGASDLGAHLSPLKKIWADPVWSKVIATGIVGAVVGGTTYVAGWWPAVAMFARRVASLAVATTTVPNWLLILLIPCAVAVLCGLGIIRLLFIVRGSRKPSFRDSYREDTFFDIRWRWHYGANEAIFDLVPFCSLCDYQIQPRDVSGYREPEIFEYRCEDCGARLHEFEAPEEEIENRVIRHIHKKIRTGSWNTNNN
jgi:hypothetical protein